LDPAPPIGLEFEARHSSGYSILLIEWGSKLPPLQSVQSQRLRAVQLGTGAGAADVVLLIEYAAPAR
jgi:hypothetical protein